MDANLTNVDIQSDTIPAYALDMDIKENMAYMKTKAGEGLNLDLTEASVWVLSQRRLSDFETLQELCGSYAGIVQIQFFIDFNEETGEQKIDILDVLKPNEETTNVSDQTNCTNSVENIDERLNKKLKTSKWIASSVFKDIQRKYGIPKNPELWSQSHVEKWLSWAKEQFILENLNPNNMKLDGKALCNMKVDQFRLLVPNDPEDIFYMHFELLRKTHIVAVIYNSVLPDDRPTSSKGKEQKERASVSPTKDFKSDHTIKDKVVRLSTSAVTPTVSSINPVLPIISVVPVSSIAGVSTSVCPESPVTPTSPTLPVNSSSGTSQPIQLWQFLLKLLTDPDATEIISWCGDNGEFKFHEPDLVAKLWGEQKGKSNMNYDKLSRSLRYYYDADKKMINKVNGKKYVYKFELDLRNILGYDSSEIQDQIHYVKKLRSK